MLFIFGGLPGTGKSTLASCLAREFGAAYLRIDSIEERLTSPAGPLGYEIAQAVAADNLRLGIRVVADCVNPTRESREGWQSVGERVGVPCLTIEVVCSNLGKHRLRVEERSAERPGPNVPTWDQVRNRHYQRWPRVDLVFDTAEYELDGMQAEFLERVRGVLRVKGLAVG